MITYRLRLLGHSDRGGVAVIVGILASTGVLLAMAALTVDVGQLYAEREELQSGADAAAMAIALDCGRGRDSECEAALATAGSYADKTARDGVSDVVRACGVDRKGRLALCTGAVEPNLTGCLGTPTPGVNYVEVYTRTERPTSSDRFILPPSFAQTLLGGNGGNGGTGVGSCARVAYGPPKHGLAFTVNVCEAAEAETKEVPYFPWPPDSSLWNREVYLGVHGPPGAACNPGSPPAGWSLPGGFDWLDEDAPCQFVLGADGIYGGDPGAPASEDCKKQLVELRDTHRVVGIPVYTWERGHGSNIEYKIDHYLPFIVTGFYLPSKSLHEPSIVTGDDPCGGNDTCIYGFVLPLGTPIQDEVGEATEEDLRLTVVKTIG